MHELPDPDESLGTAADAAFVIGRPVAVHLPGAGDTRADQHAVELLLRLRPGLLFVAGSVS